VGWEEHDYDVEMTKAAFVQSQKDLNEANERIASLECDMANLVQSVGVLRDAIMEIVPEDDRETVFREKPLVEIALGEIEGALYHQYDCLA